MWTRTFLSLAALAIIPQLGQAATPCRQIFSITLPITQPGRYCFAWDINSPSGAGLVIRSDNVVVDFQGHKLSTPSNPTSTVITTGVDASMNQNITVMNGTIQGYIDGINFGERVPANNVGNFAATNMRIDQSVSNFWRSIGIFAEGANFTLTNNTITNLTGSEGFGMLLHGSGDAIVTLGKIVVANNRIDHVTAVAGDHADGISLDGGAETLVNDNVITEVYSGGTTPNQFQKSFGFEIASLAPNSLTEVGGNTVRNVNARANTTGIRLNTHGDQVAFVRDSTIGNMNTGLDLGGSCVPYYSYNTVTGAATPYQTSFGTQVPCNIANLGPGPGNR